MATSATGRRPDRPLPGKTVDGKSRADTPAPAVSAGFRRRLGTRGRHLAAGAGVSGRAGAGSCGRSQGALPSPELPFSTHFGAVASQNESAPTVEESVPMVQVSTPALRTPSLAFRKPILLVEVPASVFRTPAPGCKTSTSSLQLSTPTHFGAALIQNEPAPTVQVSASIVQESTPAVQESTQGKRIFPLYENAMTDNCLCKPA